MTAESLSVAKPREVEPALPQIPQPPLLIFHINDNTDDQVLFQAACKEAEVPFQWHVAESAGRGISYFNSLLALSRTQSVRWPDLVILDLIMPDGTGLKVLEFIRTTPKLSALPVIILTGHATEAFQESAAKLGANSFYEKPSNFADLVQLVTILYRIWSSARRPTL